MRVLGVVSVGREESPGGGSYYGSPSGGISGYRCAVAIRPTIHGRANRGRGEESSPSGGSAGRRHTLVVVARLAKNKNCKQPSGPDSHGTVEATPWGPRALVLSRASLSLSLRFPLFLSRALGDPVELSQRAARRYVISSRSRGVCSRARRTALRRIRVVSLHNKPHFDAE